jgi:hypothetical protein
VNGNRKFDGGLFRIVRVRDQLRDRGADLRAQKTFGGVKRADLLILKNFDGEEGIRLAFDVGDAIF